MRTRPHLLGHEHQVQGERHSGNHNARISGGGDCGFRFGNKADCSHASTTRSVRNRRGIDAIGKRRSGGFPQRGRQVPIRCDPSARRHPPHRCFPKHTGIEKHAVGPSETQEAPGVYQRHSSEVEKRSFYNIYEFPYFLYMILEIHIY